RRSGDRAQPPEGRGRGAQRPRLPRGAEGVRLLRRLCLALRRRPAAAAPAAADGGRPGAHAGIRRTERRSAPARLHLRRLDDLLCVHAGGRHGERSSARLLARASGARVPETRFFRYTSGKVMPPEEPMRWIAAAFALLLVMGMAAPG